MSIADLLRSGNQNNPTIVTGNEAMTQMTFPELYGGMTRQQVQASRPGYNTQPLNTATNAINSIFGAISGIASLFGGRDITQSISDAQRVVSGIQTVNQAVGTISTASGQLGGAFSNGTDQNSSQANTAPAYRAGLTGIQMQGGSASLSFNNLDAPVTLKLTSASQQDQRQAVVDFVNTKIVVDQFIKASGFTGTVGIPNATADGKGNVSFELRLTDSKTGQRSSQWIQLDNVRGNQSVLAQQLQTQIYGSGQNQPTVTAQQPNTASGYNGQQSTRTPWNPSLEAFNPMATYSPPGSDMLTALQQRASQGNNAGQQQGNPNQTTGSSSPILPDLTRQLSSLLFEGGKPSSTVPSSPSLTTGTGGQPPTSPQETTGQPRTFAKFEEYQQYYAALTNRGVPQGTGTGSATVPTLTTGAGDESYRQSPIVSQDTETVRPRKPATLQELQEIQQYYGNLTNQNGQRIMGAYNQITNAGSNNAAFGQGIESLVDARKESRQILRNYFEETRKFLPFTPVT